MNINKKSWHYRLINHFTPQHKEMPSNICTYFWKVVSHLLLFILFVALFVFVIFCTAQISTRYYFKLNLDFLNINHLEPIIKDLSSNPFKFGLFLINENLFKFLVILTLGIIGFIIIAISFWSPIILFVYLIKGIGHLAEAIQSKIKNSPWCRKINYKD